MTATIRIQKRDDHEIKLRMDERGSKSLADIIWMELGLLDWTYERLAEESGVSLGTIRNYVLNPPTIRGPFLWKVIAVLSALGYDVTVHKRAKRRR